ncbi:MAG: hypothetical protein V4658_03285 [Bacteroidota bacterium]
MFTTVILSHLYSIKIYRIAACKTALMLLLALLLNTRINAQQKMVQYYAQELPVYPVKADLLKGLVANRTGKITTAFIQYTLASAGEIYIDSFTLKLQPGISDVLSDSSVLNKRDPVLFDYLLPGNYTFMMQFAANGDTTRTEKKIIVPPYRFKPEKKDSNSIWISTQPALTNLEVYACIKEATSSNKGGKTAGCFFTSETLLSRSQFRQDTLATYLYDLRVYHKGIFLGSTGFKPWKDLTGQSIDGGDKERSKASSKLAEKVQVNASVGVEYGYTNARYVNQLSATQYVRFYFKPTITVLGVPLTFNSMVTTENNFNYPVNFFQFGFDANKFRSDFQNNAVKDQLETAHRLELNKAELGEVNKLLMKYKKHDQPARISIPDSPDTSLKRRLGRQRKEQKMQELELKVQGLETRKQVLEYQRYKDSVYLNARKWNEPDLDTVQRFIKKQRYKNLTKTLLAIRSFNIGLCTPHYSDLTLSQVPLQGIHADLKFNKWFVSATAGNRITFQPTLGLRALLQPSFENKTYAGKLGISNRRTRTSVHVAYFYFENKADSFNRSPQQNTILSAGIENHFLPWLLFTGELAKSFYQSNRNDPFRGERYSMANSFAKAYGNVSFNTSLTINATKTTDLSATLKRIGNGYYTLGIPFLRNDYMEYTFGWKQFYWLRQFETEVTYMRNRDNLEGNKTNTTILTGYGASLKTHFRTRPNLLVLYKPFNTSFSFEENLLNPVNTQPSIITQQFYLFHATVFYTQKVKQAGLLNTGLSYNRSNNHNSLGNIYRLETVSANISLSDKQGRQLAYVVSLYQSTIRSNNSMLHDASCSAGLFKNKVRATAGAVGQWINDGRQRVGPYGQVAYVLKTFTISCRLSSNYLKGNWFVNNPAFEHAVNVFLEWRL